VPDATWIQTSPVIFNSNTYTYCFIVTFYSAVTIISANNKGVCGDLQKKDNNSVSHKMQIFWLYKIDVHLTYINIIKLKNDWMIEFV